MSPATSRHRPKVLAAAVTLLAEHGARGLTHAAVDSRTGLPAGTTSNYFRTRDALLGGALDHILERDENAAREAEIPEALDRESLTDLLVGFVEQQCGPDREFTLARYAVFLEAATRPELAERVAQARRSLNATLEDVLTRAGAHDPGTAGQRIAATMDGYILGTVSHGAITAPLRDVLAPVVATAFDDPAPA